MEQIERTVLKYHNMYRAENLACWTFSDYLKNLLESRVTLKAKMEILFVLKWEQSMDELLYELSTL